MISESELLDQLKNNPEQGLHHLMKVFTGYVFTIVRGHLAGICQREDIEECVSDIFFELYQNRNRIDLSKGSIKVYLSVLAKRKSIDLFRKLQRGKDTVSLEDADESRLDAENDPQINVTGKELQDRLIFEIKALGEPDSEILLRRFYLRQSTKEVGKALSMKPNTVDQRGSRALKKLKEILGGAL